MKLPANDLISNQLAETSLHPTQRGRRLDFLHEALTELAEQQRLRAPSSASERGALTNLASNDYLALGRRQASGATGSRLITGDHQELRGLERELARWLDLPSALVFTSGYAANVGALSALLGPEDVVASDALNHASLIDGMRLSRAKVLVFAHNDLEHARALLTNTPGRRRWLVTESYFSMDADSPDLVRARALCDELGALLFVDEAHALGLYGERGRGRLVEQGVVADVMTAGLGKGLGVQGGFVAGSPELSLFLWNRARSFVFSTGLSPLVARAARQNLVLLQDAEAARARIFALSERVRAALSGAGLQVLGEGPLVPIVLGSEARVLRAAATMAERGFQVQPIRPPTVPANQARLRLTLSAAESEADIDALVEALVAALG